MNTLDPQTETHPLFPSGEWEGFYTYAYGPNANRFEMQFSLDFHREKVHGSGVDEVGAFSWKGNYDTDLKNCQLTKFYLGKHAVFYNGVADENGIWGVWTIPPLMKGGFHIWPKDKSKGKEEKEVAEKEVELVAVVRKPMQQKLKY